MAKVARSSKGQGNVNKLVFHRQDIYFQTHPGKWGEPGERSIGPKIEYTLRQNGQFSQSGFLDDDGCAKLLIQGGCKAQLCALGSQYELKMMSALSSYESFLGVQQRLRLLGYLDREASDKWDQAIDRAILNFQADHDLEAHGILDDETITGIKEAFGE
ncbi:peptidoglycan-binding domain-containing protein [Ningiella sp. W23]|uniref:peptidoglycan-binding domain-containing protein n=1 Tax=Ningiella sp. W23 TaxID=3023715 RepID=UPI00375805FE